MDKRFHSKLSSKIIISVLFSILISFLAIGLIVHYLSSRIIRDRIISDLRLNAKIIGLNSSAALLFEDKKVAKDILSSLRLLPEIQSAILFDRSGREFAYFIREGGIYIPYYTEVLNSDKQIVVVEEIEIEGEQIGKIVIVSNTDRITGQTRLVTYGVIFGIIGALLIAYILMSLFTKVIFKPVKNLLDVMHNVSEKRDYSLRAEIVSGDEFGSIASSFNEMLAQIQLRDEEINRYREHLEDEVKKRTKELEELSIRLEKELEEVKRMEEIISRSATEWRTTFDSINDAVFLLDRNGNILKCNKSAIKILGVTYSDIIQSNICKVAHNSDNCNCGISDAFRDKIRVTRILHIKDKIYQIYFDPIISKDNLMGLVHIMSDITERHLIEEGIQHMQKMEAVGRLAGGVAHDFNNLLSILTLYTSSLLKRLKDDERSLKELSEIKKVIERATNLSRQLLTFSRKQIINPEVFDICDALNSLHKMLSRLIGEHIDIKLELPEGGFYIFADRSQFDNVIMNLVINAKDAMPDGGVITISAEKRVLKREDISIPELWDRDFIILKVADNGEGMSEEIQKKIFEPFFTTKPKGRGTGLGLTIVYGFVRQCNGYIDVRSRLKEGTTFTLYFPPAAQRVSNRPVSALIKALTIKNLSILLVEDDEDVRRSLKKMLEDNSFRVIDKGRAIEAIGLLRDRKDRIDLIISDIVMPEMNGIDFFKKVREFDSEIPFILMTGYSDEFLPQEDISTYRDILIQKPFTETQIINKIREMIK
ncbi:MAG: ATP-binding protein [Myxococcota bacterium]